MKKISKSILAACLAATCVLGNTVGATPIKSIAASTSVRAGYDSAQTIDILKNGITGSLNGEGKSATLCYKYTAKKNMVVKSALSIEGNGDVEWKFKKKVHGVYVAVESWCKETRDGVAVSTTPLEKNAQYVVEVKYKTQFGNSMDFTLVFEDAEDEGEKLSEAKNHKVKVGGGKAGKLNYQGDHDYYMVNTGKYTGMKVTVDAGEGTYPTVEVLDTKGRRVSEVNNVYVSSSGYIYTNKALKKHTNYVIHIYWWNGYGLKMSEGDYHFHIKGYDDVANSASKATRIKVGKTVKSRNEYRGDKDYFKFTATKTKTMTIKATNSSCDNIYGQNVTVYRKGSSQKLVDRVSFGKKSKFKVQKGKTYIVVIERTDNTKGIDGVYSFKVK